MQKPATDWPFDDMFSSKTQDRLRRSMSSRSIRRSRTIPDADRLDPEFAKAQAAAAAARAMRSSRSSNESSNAYDRLGGPGSMAVPRLRQISRPHRGERIPLPECVIGPIIPYPSSKSHGTAYINDGDPSALESIDEFGGLDGRISSLPSSYRRLRKVKSMFSTRQRLSHFTHGTPSIPKRSSCDPNNPDFELPRTLRHSVSHIRSIPQGSREDRPVKDHGAVQLAREQFYNESAKADSQPRRPSFFSSRHGNHKPFRKSFRGTCDASPEQISMRVSREKPRTISATIKYGLRRVFGLSKTTDQHAVHRVESDASESSVVVNAYMGCKTNGAKAFENPNTRYLQQNKFVPLSMYSPNGSVCTSNSRVTSWADSTVANTATTRNNKRHTNDLPQLSEHHSTNCQSSSHQRGSSRRFDGSKYSKDLYTALKRQMDRDIEYDPDQEITIDSVPGYRVPAPTSSAHSHLNPSMCAIHHSPSITSVSTKSYATAQGSLSPQKHHLPENRPIPRSRGSRYGLNQENCRPSVFSSQGVATSSSPYTISEQSDEDIEGAILSQFGPPVERPFTPSSTYSRSGENLATADDSDCDTPYNSNSGEPGTATIFATERTVYGSPARLVEPVSPRSHVQSSADWTNWMSTQVEDLDRMSPVTEHLRQYAEFEDDEESVLRPTSNTDFADITFNAHSHDLLNMHSQILPKPSSNYSRPLSRSSSVRTIKTGPNRELDYPSKVSSSNTITNENAPTRVALAPGPILSTMRIRSHKLPQMPESPSPSPRRVGPLSELQRPKWSQERSQRPLTRRPIATGRAGQFRSMRTHRDTRGLNNENLRQQEEHDDIMREYHNAHDLHSTTSSKNMVDMFLDSRRRKEDLALGIKDEVFL